MGNCSFLSNVSSRKALGKEIGDIRDFLVRELLGHDGGWCLSGKMMDQGANYHLHLIT